METPRHWRLREQRYTLSGTVCTECGKTFFTPRPICDVCNKPTAENEQTHRIRRAAALAYEPAQR